MRRITVTVTITITITTTSNTVPTPPPPHPSLEDAKTRARVADDGVEKARRRHEKSLLALKQARMLERKAHQEAAIDFEEEVSTSSGLALA